MNHLPVLAAVFLLAAHAALAEPVEAARGQPAPDAATQTQPAQPVQRIAARRRARPQESIPEPPPPAPPLPGRTAISRTWGEPAPIPNRDIEPPRDRFAGPPRATLEPVIIDERELNRGFTFGREHLSSRQEVLGKDLAPGARIRIPLE
jgi:hypothetical protein